MKINEIKRIFGLSISLAKAHLKLKIEGSYLGFFWYLINPLLTFLVLLFVFSRNLGSQIPSYPLYLLLGIIMFNFFQINTQEATQIIRGEFLLVKSISLPHEIFIFAIFIKNLFTHILEAFLLIVFFLIYGAPVFGVIFYIFVFFVFSLFVIGISLLLFAVRIYILDFDNIWSFACRLLWFGTPLFYSAQQYGKLFFVNLFNPLYYFITIAREILIYLRMPEWWLVLGAVGYSLVFLAGGAIIFNKLKHRFTELV